MGSPGNWTFEQVNEILAISGVRSPGVTVHEPERIVAALLLDARVENAALRDEIRKVQANVEKAEQRRDELEKDLADMQSTQQRNAALAEQIGELLKRIHDLETTNKHAFTLVRELETKIRSAAAQ